MMGQTLRKTIVGLASTAALCALAVPASAITFTGGFTVISNTSDPGLVVNSSPVGDGTVSFSLDEVGDSTGYIDLFNIWTNETSVNSDDRQAQPITVGFDFTEPAPTFSGSVNGETDGHVLGFIQSGSVSWANTLVLSFGQGGTGTLLVQLSDEIFNIGLLGLSEGSGRGATVQAKFVLAAAPVPIPPALALFGGGIAALGWWARRRRRPTAAPAAA